MIRPAATLFCLLLCFNPLDLFAQTNDGAIPPIEKRAFETIRIAVGPAASLHAVHLDSWTADYGGAVKASTPFYFGEIELGMSILPWKSNDPVLPDFMSALIFGGWFVSTAPEKVLKASAGVRMGNYFMAFDSPQVSGERNESEFAISSFLGIRSTFWRGLEGFAEINAVRVLTTPRLDMVSVSTGVSITFDTPDWLEGILK